MIAAVPLSVVVTLADHRAFWLLVGLVLVVFFGYVVARFFFPLLSCHHLGAWDWDSYQEPSGGYILAVCRDCGELMHHWGPLPAGAKD